MSLRSGILQKKTTTYTTTFGELVVCDATSAAFAVTLPAVAPGLAPITVKKTDASANAVTVTRAGSATIDGATTYALGTQYKSVTLISDGTNWLIIAAV